MTFLSFLDLALYVAMQDLDTFEAEQSVLNSILPV